MQTIEAYLLERKIVNENTNNDLGIFIYRPKKEIKYKAGQYTTLTINKKDLETPIKRPYSIASAEESNEIELFIKLVKSKGRRNDGKGILTTEIFSENISDLTYTLTDAKGRFLINDFEDRNVIMVATGTGIAPCLSILRTLMLKTKSSRRHILIYGASSPSSLVYTDELNYLGKQGTINLKNIFPNSSKDFSHGSIPYVCEFFLNRKNGANEKISQDEIQEAIKEGRIENAKIEKIIGEKLSPKKYVSMFCGNPIAVQSLTELLKARNFEIGKDIICEEHWTEKWFFIYFFIY